VAFALVMEEEQQVDNANSQGVKLLRKRGVFAKLTEAGLDVEL